MKGYTCLRGALALMNVGQSYRAKASKNASLKGCVSFKSSLILDVYFVFKGTHDQRGLGPQVQAVTLMLSETWRQIHISGLDRMCAHDQ